MRLLKKLSLGCLTFLVLVAVVFVIFIGPWPAYKSSNYQASKYYKKALEDIKKQAQDCEMTSSPGPLQAGWATRVMTPKIGSPMGGYGARAKVQFKSKGVHDDLHVKALALSDGKDCALIFGSDMLIIPPNVAELVRKEVASKTPLTASNILFTASHSHCGPGGFGPGIAAYFTGGKYDPEMPGFLAKQFSEAGIEAYKALEPAKLAAGGADAKAYVHNRVKGERPVDPELSIMVVEQMDGDRCVVVNFGAHPTLYDDDMLEYSAEWPGALQSDLERDLGGTAIYLGGAVGASSASAPEAPDAEGKVAAMGEAMAKLVVEAIPNLTFGDRYDVASLGIPVGMPSMQLRPMDKHPGLRLSPMVGKILQVPGEGWIQGIRVGCLFFWGVPCDLNSELSVMWKERGGQRGLDVWTSGFSGSYCGYFTPTKYYNDMGYESGFMSWFGPDIEAYFTDLFDKTLEALTPTPCQTDAGTGEPLADSRAQG